MAKASRHVCLSRLREISGVESIGEGTNFQTVIVFFVIPNRFSGEESAFASFSAAR
jgi:hypothetical protein